MTAGTDRALHDALIRLLADAPFRDALDVLATGAALDGIPPDHLAALRAVDPERVRRFAHFLARQYYYERIAHFHRQSSALARWTHRAPEAVLRSPEFDALLPTLVLGSRRAATDLAHLLMNHLTAATAPTTPPYAADLVRYENAQLIVESGSRVWRSANETSTGEPSPPDADARLVADPATIALDLAWDIPALLPALWALTSAGPEDPDTGAPRGIRTPTSLIVSRTPRGRVAVLQCPPAAAALFARFDRPRTVANAASGAGVPPGEALDIVRTFAAAGALRPG